jgi:hypothetical protein
VALVEHLALILQLKNVEHYVDISVKVRVYIYINSLPVSPAFKFFYSKGVVAHTPTHPTSFNDYLILKKTNTTHLIY